MTSKDRLIVWALSLAAVAAAATVIWGLAGFVLVLGTAFHVLTVVHIASGVIARRIAEAATGGGW